MAKRNKQYEEYNRGRMQGLEMAYRLLRDEGQKEAAEIIRTEIHKRGQLPVQLPVTTKEVDSGLEALKWCMYETFMCQALMVLHDQFDFGRIRCKRFIDRWNFKTDCLGQGLASWQDYIDAIKEELGIDVPTECMREEGLIS